MEDREMSLSSSLFWLEDMGFDLDGLGCHWLAEGVAVHLETSPGAVEFGLIMPRCSFTISVPCTAITLKEHAGADSLRSPCFDDKAHPGWIRRTLRGAIWMLRNLNAYGFGNYELERNWGLDAATQRDELVALLDDLEAQAAEIRTQIAALKPEPDEPYAREWAQLAEADFVDDDQSPF
jgi:hypothetical protein